MTDLDVSWSEYHCHIEQLAVKIDQSGWKFNQIVCIAKGGLRIGDILCRLYDQPLAILFAASYGGTGNRERGKIRFADNLAMIGSELGDQVLLIDDLADSGASLIESKEWLKTNYGEQITEIKTGVIWYKSCSVIIPDYYVAYLTDNPWIRQPFEVYEALSPDQLQVKS